MSKFFLIIILVLLTGCNRRLQQYDKIINKVNRVEVKFKNTGKVVKLSNQEIETFKKILIRNIKPEFQRKFINNISVDLFKDSTRVGNLMITENSENSFVNFNSDGLNFGFRLTYGIGMFIDDFK